MRFPFDTMLLRQASIGILVGGSDSESFRTHVVREAFRCIRYFAFPENVLPLIRLTAAQRCPVLKPSTDTKDLETVAYIL